MDIPKSRNAIQIEGARFRSPVSEALIQQIGATINYIFDITFQPIDFTTSGTWVVPLGLTKIFVLGVGAGGGGGGGGYSTETGAGPADAGGGGGGGGQGCVPRIFILPTVPGETLTITIGAGGSAGLSGSTTVTNGGAGSNTTITGSLFSVTMVGGSGGLKGNPPVSAPNPGIGGIGGNSVSAIVDVILTNGGTGGDGGDAVAPVFPNTAATRGQSSTWAAGGTVNGTLANGRGGPGGSGGAGLQAGGNGGTPGLFNGANAPDDAVAGGIGAGGGGGGGAGGRNSGGVGSHQFGAPGKKGGNGFVSILYFGGLP